MRQQMDRSVKIAVFTDLRSQWKCWCTFVTISLCIGTIFCVMQAMLAIPFPMSYHRINNTPEYGRIDIQERVCLERWILSETISGMPEMVSFRTSPENYRSLIYYANVKRSVGWPIAWLWVEYKCDHILLDIMNQKVTGRDDDRMGKKRISDISLPRLLVFLSFWIGCGLMMIPIIRLIHHLHSAMRTKRGLCSRCGYPLFGLPSSICPECGHTQIHNR